MASPYDLFPPRNFWKTGVPKTKLLTPFPNIYFKKFEIAYTDRIVTAGSCFAQHIARQFRAHGFNFCDYEPSPEAFPHANRAKFNYGVYSARYCNIYTVRQLLQTFERAFGEREPQERGWKLRDGVVDPFRPALEPEPFVDEAEMLAARQSHLKAVRRVFEESDLFVFTLGLTEAWISRHDGSVFPMCPGTAGGQFNDQDYVFCNLTFGEIWEDLNLFVAKFRKINPGVRILLTVSPVPLTATASENHVLVATTYSKSVLRAIAGQMSSSDPLIDYFPSYELVASPPIRGQLFKKNLREVEPDGVDFVMKHFFAQHAERAKEKVEVSRNVEEKESDIEREDDVICEEVMLEAGLQ